MPKHKDTGDSQTRAKEPHFSFSHSAVGLAFLIAAVGLVFVIGNGFTGAQTIDISRPDGMFEFLKQGTENANKYNDQIPSFFKTLFGNERITGTVYLSSGDTLIVGVVTQDAKIIQFQRGKIEDPTLKVYTDEATIRRILTAQDPAAAAREAINNRQIWYEAVTLAGEVKYGTTSFVSRVLSWFGW